MSTPAHFCHCKSCGAVKWRFYLKISVLLVYDVSIYEHFSQAARVCGRSCNAFLLTSPRCCLEKPAALNHDAMRSLQRRSHCSKPAFFPRKVKLWRGLLSQSEKNRTTFVSWFQFRFWTSLFLFGASLKSSLNLFEGKGSHPFWANFPELIRQFLTSISNKIRQYLKTTFWILLDYFWTIFGLLFDFILQNRVVFDWSNETNFLIIVLCAFSFHNWRCVLHLVNTLCTVHVFQFCTVQKLKIISYGWNFVHRSSMTSSSTLL